jgi:purine-cytosine permease-like protein
VRVKRLKLQRLANVGQRTGWILIAVAVAGFAWCVATGFPSGVVAIVIAALIACCVVMPPAMVLGYAVRAAEREDREAGR